MKISAKARYAIRSMIYLTINLKSGEHISLKEISEKESISIKYLEQIFTALRKEGLVKSIKGSYGGYILAKQPEEITIGEVIRTIEGEMYTVSGSEKNEFSPESIEYYMITKYWEELNILVNTYFDKKNLAEMVKDYTDNVAKNQGMFYI